MNLSQIRDLIAAESDKDDFPLHVIDIYINQHLQELTGKSKYEELRTEVLFSFAGPTILSEFDLPADFQLFESLTFNEFPNDPDWRPRTMFASKLYPYQYGSPRFYTRQGNKIKIFPWSEYTSQQSISLWYYKRPTLVNNDDVFPVPSLERAVIEYVVARILRMSSTAQAAVRSREGDKAYLASRAEDAGNHQ